MCIIQSDVKERTMILGIFVRSWDSFITGKRQVIPSNMKKAKPIIIQHEFLFTGTKPGPDPPRSSASYKAKYEVMITQITIKKTAIVKALENFSIVRIQTIGLYKMKTPIPINHKGILSSSPSR